MKDAIILAGGQGTRMLPATFYCPKEFLPLVDVPLIHHLVWESINAGIERIHLVVSPDKLPFAIRLKDGDVRLREKRPDLDFSHLCPISEEEELIIHLQERSLGVGNAISIACKDLDGPFLVLLGDNAIIDEDLYSYNAGPEQSSPASRLLVKRFEETGRACVGVIEVDSSELDKFGIISQKGNTMSGVVEKPEVEHAPSNLALCGRYLFLPGSFQILKEVSEGDDVELQSIRFLNQISSDSDIEVVNLSQFVWVDAGDPISWFEAQDKLFFGLS